MNGFVCLFVNREIVSFVKSEILNFGFIPSVTKGSGRRKDVGVGYLMLLAQYNLGNVVLFCH